MKRENIFTKCSSNADPIRLLVQQTLANSHDYNSSRTSQDIMFNWEQKGLPRMIHESRPVGCMGPSPASQNEESGPYNERFLPGHM